MISKQWIITILWYWLLIKSDSITMESKIPDDTNLNDMYVTSDGGHDWCLFCHKADIYRFTENIQRQCVEQNPLINKKEPVYDSNYISDVQWCSKPSRGRPPRCPELNFPNHTRLEFSRPAFPYYTHTTLNVSCEEGFYRDVPGEPQDILLTCLSQRRWDQPLPKSFRCVPISPEIIKDGKEDVGLSQGVYIPIGVAIGVIFILLIFWMIRYYKKDFKPTPSPSTEVFVKPCPESRDFDGGIQEPAEHDELLVADRPAEYRQPPVGSECPSFNEAIPICKSSPDDKSEMNTTEHCKACIDDLTENTYLKEVVVSNVQPLPNPPAEADSVKIVVDVEEPACHDDLTEPVNLVGSPDRCSCLLSQLEEYDNGKVHEELIEHLDPVTKLYGKETSWVALAKAEGFTKHRINYIYEKKRTDMLQGPTAYVINDMVEKGRYMGHLVRVLHSTGLCLMISRILTFHKDCSYCSQFGC